MSLFARLVRGLALALAGLLLLTALAFGAYALYAHLAWADIEVAELETRYGDDELRRTEIDGVQVRYRWHAAASDARPVLVLIHSHFFDMGMWDDWVDILRPDYRILRYDLSGHGLTGPDPAGVYSIERDAALLHQLIAKLGIESATLVGSSLGGSIAFSYAARHSVQVDALVLINSGGIRRPGSRSDRELPGWADTLMPLVPPAAYRRFLRWIAVDSAAVDADLERRFVDMWRRAGNREAELARLRQFESRDPSEVLARIQAPTLILWGEANPQLPHSLAEIFAEKLVAAPAVTVRKYPGAGHLLPVERPRASAEHVHAFLSGVLAR